MKWPQPTPHQDGFLRKGIFSAMPIMTVAYLVSHVS